MERDQVPKARIVDQVLERQALDDEHSPRDRSLICPVLDPLERWALVFDVFKRNRLLPHREMSVKLSRGAIPLMPQIWACERRPQASRCSCCRPDRGSNVRLKHWSHRRVVGKGESPPYQP